MAKLYRRGKMWWMRYTDIHGVQRRESCKTTVKAVANKVLIKVEADTLEGNQPYTDYRKRTFDELVELIRSDYLLNQKDSRRLEVSLKHLSRKFAGWSIPSITSTEIQKYTTDRIKFGAAVGTVNRERAALRRMMNLGADQVPPLVNPLNRVKIPALAEDNVKQGFFEEADYLAFRDKLPPYLHGVVTFGYQFGWRWNEVVGLTWGQVDRQRWTVRVDRGVTKGKEARLIYLTDELIEMFQHQWSVRGRGGVVLPWVFPNRSGKGQISDIRWSWEKAVKEARIPRKTFHDLRRTAVRNMVRNGLPEKVAMLIAGFKTREVFERYNIVDERDLAVAKARMDEVVNARSSTQIVHNFSTMERTC